MTCSALLLVAALLAGCTTPATDSAGPPSPADAAVPAPAPAPDTDADPSLDGATDDTDYRAFFEGSWTADDPEGGFSGLACPKALDVQFDQTQVLCIVPNQIWITARWTLDEAAGQAHLLLVGPEDVGAGGARMPWDEFSPDAPIATMEPALGEGRYATVTWHGFQMRSGEPYGDDSGDWYSGDYSPADGDTRIPTRSAP